MISGLCWLGMLLGLLVTWNIDGRPHYPSMENDQSVAYISDVGADKLKPLFIAGSCVTTIFLDLSFFSERWLRHRGRLAANVTMTEKVLSGLSMGFAVIGTAGLILLSIFDTRRYPTLHDIFLLLFIVGYVVSAIFICWEYQRLGASTFLSFLYFK
jgi:Frag1/DRAM/Sfk1 family